MVAIYSEMVPFCTNRTKWNHSRPNTASPLSRRAKTARPAGRRYAFFLNSEGVSSKWRLKQMLNYFGLAKPVMIEISEIVRSDSRSSWAARFSRMSMMNSLIDMPVMSFSFW